MIIYDGFLCYLDFHFRRMLREYLKLARSFNAVLTGIAPVIGAIAMQQYDLLILIVLFFIGFFGHIFGFVFNDIIDYHIDKSSKDINDRPLVSGTISLRNAKAFAFGSMIIAFVLSLYLAFSTNRFFPLLILVVSALLVIIYDLVSKKFLFTDIFIALGVFFLILYGASNGALPSLTVLAFIVCLLGAIQVLFMQIVTGGIKDIENDFKRGAKTLALHMGVRVSEGKLHISPAYKALAYGIQLVDLSIVFLPFFIVWNVRRLSLFQYFQWVTLFLLGVLMFLLTYKLLTMEGFDRMRARKYIGSHYLVNFSLVPIMLMTLENPWPCLLIIFPVLGFVFSNIVLHGTLLQPKTM